jgi:nucleoside-diphosphate-sugar epimerase
LGALWLEAHPGATVVGQTNTTNNHAMLQTIGISPRVGPAEPHATYPNVAFCAPPSGSEDYPADVAKALACWDGTGNFIFTSSAGVYNVNDGSPCNEASPVFPPGANPRTDALLKAEQACLEAGGCVVRLVGLYHRTRGPHTFFLKQGEVARWGGYMVNMIHYEDAAGLCAAVLKGQGADDKKYRSEVFVGCDDAPISFEDMMAAISRSGVLEGTAVFTERESGGNLGKKMSNEKTREQLGWSPKYPSIASFFEESKGEDWYFKCSESAAVKGMPHA